MAETQSTRSGTPPYRSKLFGPEGVISFDWEQFIRWIYSTLSPLGIEQSAQLENSLVVADDIPGMQFNGSSVSYILVEYFVQRFHAGSTKLVEGGTLRLSYNAKTPSWTLTEISGSGPNDAGIVFSITSAGQVQYTTSNISGAKQVSKITWRARTLSARVAVPAGGFS